METLKKFNLFQDLFVDERHIFQSFLQRFFVPHVMLIVDFCLDDLEKKITLVAPGQSHVQVTEKKELRGSASNLKQSSTTGFKQSVRSKKIDISDSQKWPITHQLLQIFGGSVQEVIKDTHEPHA